jgi:hypothetical protein
MNSTWFLSAIHMSLFVSISGTCSMILVDGRTRVTQHRPVARRRALAEFMSQRQSSVAAFIHNCFLVRNDPNSAPLVLHGAESPSDRTTEEPELSELVEYDGFD